MSWTRTATVSTTLGDDVLLFYAMTAREELSRPFVYEVELLSDDLNIDLAALLGQPISIGLETTGESYREFNGVVSDIALVGELGRYVLYRAAVRPWLWLLTQRKNSRIFQEQSVPDVFKAIFRELGFSDFIEHLSPDLYAKRDYLVQYRETDFNFVSRIMEEEGIYYFFKHEGGKHTLVLCDSYSDHEPTPGYETVPYFPKHEGERRERDHVDSWLSAKRVRPGAYSAYDFNYLEPKEPKKGELSAPNQHAEASYPVFEYPGGFQQNKDGDALARIRLEELQTDYEVVKGTGNARGLTAGALFSLSGFPREDQNKEYLLVEVSYRIHVSGYESGKDPDEPPDYRVSFSAIDSHRPYRPPRVTSKPTVEGPQTAFVVGQSGQELFTDEYGRVKVRFHWDRDETPDEKASCWVRVAQIWAGSGFGGIHLPRIGQEVIVDFLEGDPDRPIVTGRVYNAVNKVPYKLPDNATQSGVKTQSSKDATTENYNEIRFEDKKGEEELHVQAEKNMTTLVKNDQSTTVQKNRSTSVGASDSVSVGGDRSVSVNGTHTVAVQKADAETYSDTRDVSVTGPDTLTITNAHTGNYNADRTLNITGADAVTVEGGKTNTVTGKYQHKATSEYVAQQGDDNQLQLTGSLAKLKNQNCSVELDGGNLTITASQQIVLQVGANSIKISADGTIALVGAMTVSAQGGQVGKLKLDPSGATAEGPMVNINGQAMVSIGGPMIKIG